MWNQFEDLNILYVYMFILFYEIAKLYLEEKKMKETLIKFKGLFYLFSICAYNLHARVSRVITILPNHLIEKHKFYDKST